jgi:hypothetical protein
MTIVIPKPIGKSKGSWGLAAIASFLAVSFIVQGLLSGNHAWTGVGLLCFIVAVWQLMSLRGLRGPDEQTKLQVTAEHLVRFAGPADRPQRTDWQRSSVSELKVEKETESNRTGLRMHFKDKQAPAWVVIDADSQELDWVAEQIRKRWGMEAAS